MTLIHTLPGSSRVCFKNMSHVSLAQAVVVQSVLCGVCVCFLQCLFSYMYRVAEASPVNQTSSATLRQRDSGDWNTFGPVEKSLTG